MAGEYAIARRYFFCMLAGVLVGVPATISYYYLRAKIKSYNPSNEVVVQTLNALGGQMKQKPKKQN